MSFPSSRRSSRSTRRRASLRAALGQAALLAAVSPAASAQAADETEGDGNACRIAVRDPRIEELLQADPTDERIEVTSDTGELGRAGDATLSGNVTIRTGQRLLKADQAELNSVERSVELHGRMEYLDPQLHVTGDSGSFVEGGGGSFEGAEFELVDRSVRGAAAGARVTPDGRLQLEGVRYTACPPGVEDWELQAGEITIDQQKQLGTGREVKLEFLGVPLFYTPWITFPVGDQRKSGLLFPTIGTSSKNGTLVAVPYYWNLAPNYDATLTSRWYSSRGFRFDPELRYLDERSRSQLNVEYMFHDDERGESRSLVDWRHVTRFAPRTRLLIDATNASDTDYFEDFGVGFEGTSVTFLNRYVDLRHDVGPWSLTARAQGYQVIDRDLPELDEPYQIVPQLAATGSWQDLPGGFAASVFAEATNFARGAGPQGVRVDALPSLAWRVDSGAAFLAATAGYRYTQYALQDVAPAADESPSRSLPSASLDAGLVLERDAGSRGNRLQTLEPRLRYLYVPYRDQDDLPVFDTGVPDLNLVQLFRENRYVGPDRVGDANQVSVGLTTRLLDSRRGHQYLSATLGQAFYFEDPRVRLPDEPARERSSSDVVAEIDVAAFKNWNARFAYQWNPDLSRGERTETFIQYAPAPGRVVNAGYRFRHDQLEQLDLSGAWPINQRWRGFARYVYSLQENDALDQFVGLEYTACCWAVRLITRRFLSSRTGDTETSFGIELELKGLSSVGVDNEAFLREAIRGYSALSPAPRL
ncbi:MAG TPA: LPS-assembly protein LptD [Steroidobacteraceae bacterium]|nr:LPS-assembly protein LptD [Steroidobacteraceae bacterium]